ncbi:hypothetical protein EG829_20510, partial [bacterium]|nr:hypothetical protein [bacterium]
MNETIHGKKLNSLPAALLAGCARWLSSTILGVGLLATGVCLGQQVIWFENFDGPYVEDDWFTDNGVWLIGPTTNGPGSAFSGRSCAAVGLRETYNPSVDSRLIGPPVDLPLIAPGEVLEVRYREWYSFSTYDAGYLQVSVYDPTNRQWSAWSDLRTVGYFSVIWNPTRVDVSVYAGQRVRWAFYHTATPPHEGAGWFIDDVELWKGTLQYRNPEGFESGLGDWCPDNGLWLVGPTTNGPGGAFSGEQCASTGLNEAYEAYVDSRLISPPVDLPSLAPGEVLEVRYREWYSFST